MFIQFANFRPGQQGTEEKFEGRLTEKELTINITRDSIFEEKILYYFGKTKTRTHFPLFLFARTHKKNILGLRCTVN